MHPFAEAVHERLQQQRMSKGALCATLRRRPAWYSDTIRRVERGAAVDPSVMEMIDALAVDDDDRRDLVMLAVAR